MNWIKATMPFEFTTNGYPDPDAWVKFLNDVRVIAYRGMMMSMSSSIVRGNAELMKMVDHELKFMGVDVGEHRY